MILVFDYLQDLKAIIGPGTKAVESGRVTSVALSADHSTIAGGHENGSIFTWDIMKPSKPFLHIPPVDRQISNYDGHVANVAILHIGFLGTRHTALVSADDKGMAFSHLATRGMGAIARSVRTTRILGRYPESTSDSARLNKPSSVLAFSPLPLGNVEQITDDMGLVAMLTPYLLVVVSTTPLAQTQHKAARPKELAVHGTMSAALAWFPAMQLSKSTNGASGPSKTKLAYCWSNVLTILDITEVESSDKNDEGKTPEIHFKSRKKWKAEEAIVGIQWLGRSVLGLLTVSQQLIILDDISVQVTDSSDLIKRHIYHVDLFSQQLGSLIEKLDEDDITMHGVVADAFYMSLKSYKGRLFLLGFNDVSYGTLSNWADRLLALMEVGDFISAIRLATSYYNGDANKAAVGLPESNSARHDLVQEKLLEMMSASLRYAFGKNQEANIPRVGEDQLRELAAACFTACLSIEDNDFLFEDVYTWYLDGKVHGIFLGILETYIMNRTIRVVPPSVVKDLTSYFIEAGLKERLEEILCHLDPASMDIDQLTSLCKEHKLYDALLFIWNQALGDYTTVLKDLLIVHPGPVSGTTYGYDVASNKAFPYLSYILTGRIFPTGEVMDQDLAVRAKASLYYFLFSGGQAQNTDKKESTIDESSFPHLRSILHLSASSFLSMLNEAFEDNFLNDSSELINHGSDDLSEEMRFGRSLNRQYIVSILLKVLSTSVYSTEDVLYLDMFIARNIPKFPQFIRLPGSVLDKVLIELCNYPDEHIENDCQLSVEYLLSIYQPPDLSFMIPLFAKARFFRVLKSIYKSEKQYALLLQTCIGDRESPEAIFECIADCLRPGAGLNRKQIEDVRNVIIEHADDLIRADLTLAASTLDEFAPDLHGALLLTLGQDEQAQFQYLGRILEPRSSISANKAGESIPNHPYIEQYVRLLCEYTPHHVSEYIDKLKTGDLRLEKVLPVLEHSGVIDAAVVLLAREGKVGDAMDRLVQHLQTLQAAMIGLLDSINETPDAANTQETLNDLVESFQKYARVGIWLCHGQSKIARISKPSLTSSRHELSLQDDLTPAENMWLDLVDVVVQVTRIISEMVESRASNADPEHDNMVLQSVKRQSGEYFNLLNSLRDTVQDSFTALLTATAVPDTNQKRHKDMSFLRILRAFLNRASLSSPSLSNLRAVLAAIFSAYSYEESLLALANRLLDNDLFVHVSEVASLRKRGWRPLGQVCEGCNRRVWGPGAGRDVWNAWVSGRQVLEGMSDDTQRGSFATVRDKNGKGKAAAMTDDELSDPKTKKGQIQRSNDGDGADQGELGPLVIFSCRHLFHRSCIEAMQATDTRDKEDVAHLVCPLCR